MQLLPPGPSCRTPEHSSVESRMEGDTPPSEGDDDRRLPYADGPILLLPLPSQSPPGGGGGGGGGGGDGDDKPSASKKADGDLGFEDEDSRAAAGEPSAPQIPQKRKLPASLANPPPTRATEPAMEVPRDDSPPLSFLDCVSIITEMLRRDKR